MGGAHEREHFFARIGVDKLPEVIPALGRHLLCRNKRSNFPEFYERREKVLVPVASLGDNSHGLTLSVVVASSDEPTDFLQLDANSVHTDALMEQVIEVYNPTKTWTTAELDCPDQREMISLAPSA